MLTIVHGSDLHFGAPYHERVGEAFAKAVETVSPDLLVISGDLTQRAKVREYEAARDYLARFGETPIVVTPGNHDVPLYRFFERMLAPFRNYRAFISEDLDTVTRVPGAVVVALNSAAPRTAIVNGRIRRRQVEFAASAFANSDPGDAKIVVSHHHFAPAPDYEGDQPLPRAREAMDAFSEMGVELIFGGHLHRAFIGNSLDLSAGRRGQGGGVIVQSGTTTSARGRARERARNSFNLVRIGEAHLEVTHYMYFDEVEAFAPFSVHAFPRGARRYFTFDLFRAAEAPRRPEGGAS
jgi:3',5'-cyclic AMP phosphodiesterase CpdA